MFRLLSHDQINPHHAGGQGGEGKSGGDVAGLVAAAF